VFLLTLVSRWVSFSIDDAFYALLAIMVIVLLLMVIVGKIKFGRFLLLVVQTVALCYALLRALAHRR